MRCDATESAALVVEGRPARAASCRAIAGLLVGPKLRESHGGVPHFKRLEVEPSQTARWDSPPPATTRYGSATSRAASSPCTVGYGATEDQWFVALRISGFSTGMTVFLKGF